MEPCINKSLKKTHLFMLMLVLFVDLAVIAIYCGIHVAIAIFVV
jgi:hypothetical protein